MAGDVEKRGGGSLRAVDGLVLVVVGVVGVVVAFWILGAIAGFLWGFVKIAGGDSHGGRGALPADGPAEVALSDGSSGRRPD